MDSHYNTFTVENEARQWIVVGLNGVFFAREAIPTNTTIPKFQNRGGEALNFGLFTTSFLAL